jgi:hypothetical protein
MAFDGEQFVTRFNTVWNGHDIDGILAMMTDDVIFEASFGKGRGARASRARRRCGSSCRDVRADPGIRWDETRPSPPPVPWSMGDQRTRAVPAASRVTAATSSRFGTGGSPALYRRTL